jgi:Arc/MetJ-type ribon-helix-helix transcriptional regulator
MGRSLHVRLDDVAEQDLRVLERDGVSASTAVRDALQLAARKRRSRSALAQVAAELAADPVDRAEMAEVRELMDELAPELEDE